MRIGEFARVTGLPASTIRYYERIGLLPKPARRSGIRDYAPSDVEAGIVLVTARDLGFSIREMRACVRGAGQSGFGLATARDAIPAKLNALEKAISRLRAHQIRLSELHQCRCRGLADCRTLEG